MGQPFHQRFNIDVGIAEAENRFVARVHNAIYTDFFFTSGVTDAERHQISKIADKVAGWIGIFAASK
jgi:hypothetical protein